MGYYWASTTEFYANYIGDPISNVYAFISSKILNLFNYGISVANTSMNGRLFDMEVGQGCDAIAPMLMLVTGIGFFAQGTLQHKMKGILIGCLVVFILNLIRLISLYLIGVHANSWFDFFHVDFWQPAFIVGTLIYFIYWIKK